MAFDFPSSPVEGQVYAPVGGPGYVYRTNRWTGSGAATDPSTAGVDAFWVTRADLVADVAGGLVVYPGKEYVAGGYSYVGKAGSTAISDLPGLEPMGTVTPFHFGGVGDGVVDDRAAIQKALDYLFANGYLGGTVDLSGGRWLVDSGDIVMRFGTTLSGGWSPANSNMHVTGTGAHATDRSAIVLNPLYTIRMKEDRSSLKGLVILRKGIYNPTTMRESITLERSFTGTAITVGDLTVYGWGAGCYVGNIFLMGFEYGIKSRTAQTVFEYVWGDCRNGIWIMEAHDWSHMTHCHFGPWLIGGTYFQQYNITNAVNNGSGLVRITVTPFAPIPGNPAYVPLVTGDYLNVVHVGGTVEINEKRWQITVINPTTFDLVGSTFTNAYTSGGDCAISPYSHIGGTAYKMGSVWVGTKYEGCDGGQAESCTAYGYDVGFHLENSQFCGLMNISTDYHALAQDYTTIGILVQASDNHARNSLLTACRITGVGTAVLIDCPTDAMTSVQGLSSTGCRNNGVVVRRGVALISNAIIEVTHNAIVVEATATAAQIIGNRTYSVTTSLVIDPVVLRSCVVQANYFTNESYGERKLIGSYNNNYFAEYSNGSLGVAQYYQKGRGSSVTPTAAASGDYALLLRGQFWDGVDTFRTAAGWRIQAQGATSATSSGGTHYWSAVANGSTTLNDIAFLSAGNFAPVPDHTIHLGGSANHWAAAWTDSLNLVDGITAPSTTGGHAKIYVDSADGDLKVKFGDGTVKTIVVDT